MYKNKKKIQRKKVTYTQAHTHHIYISAHSRTHTCTRGYIMISDVSLWKR